MSANRIFLVCSHHPSIEDALLIADRHDGASQYRVPECRCLGKCMCGTERSKRENAWFAKHERCAPGRDHFQLAMHRPPNHDSREVKPVAAAVHLAVINGSKPQ